MAKFMFLSPTCIFMGGNEVAAIYWVGMAFYGNFSLSIRITFPDMTCDQILLKESEW